MIRVSRFFKKDINIKDKVVSGFIDKVKQSEKISFAEESIQDMLDVSDSSMQSEISRLPYTDCYFELPHKNDSSFGINIHEEKVLDGYIYSSSIAIIKNKQIDIAPLTMRHISNYEYIDGVRKMVASYDFYDDDLTDNEQVEIAETYGSLVGVVLRMMAVIACSNVELIDNVKYSYKKKHGKVRKGLPLYTYKTLHIKPSATQTKNISDSIGTHASPRLHLRRGHIRELQSGETTWVQSCMVGTKDNGIVEKEYSIS